MANASSNSRSPKSKRYLIGGAKELIKSAIPRSAITYRLKAGSTPSVLLTFDDGPHPVLTPRVLEALDRLGTKAVFFVVGDRIGDNEKIVRDIADAGHIIANHSFSHRDFSGATLASVRDDLSECQSILYDITGRRPQYFRPPYGRLTPAIMLATYELGLRIVHWSNEGGEWGRNQDCSADEIAQRVSQSLADRQIVLFHDDCDRVIDVLNNSEFITSIKKFETGQQTLSLL
jgi:peptidoglycan-N-acetylglucosamine deacetylase